MTDNIHPISESCNVRRLDSTESSKQILNDFNSMSSFLSSFQTQKEFFSENELKIDNIKLNSF